MKWLGNLILCFALKVCGYNWWVNSYLSALGPVQYSILVKTALGPAIYHIIKNYSPWAYVTQLLFKIQPLGQYITSHFTNKALGPAIYHTFYNKSHFHKQISYLHTAISLILAKTSISHGISYNLS